MLLAKSAVKRAPVLNSLLKPICELPVQLFCGPPTASAPAMLRMKSATAAHS